jgi:NCS1 family nucleobase:cation symporter-1
VNVEALYHEDGEYRYQGGWHINALIAAQLSAPSSPSSCPTSPAWLPSWWGIYGWFFGVAIAGVVYYALAMMRPRTAMQAG